MAEQTFFQIAAALIPTLLFGGLLAERLRPPDRSRWSSHRAAGLALAATTVVAFFFLAEITAITGALTRDIVGEFGEWIVVTAVVLGTGLIGVAVLVPWIAAIEDRAERRQAIVGMMALLFLVCGLGGGWLLHSSIGVASSIERIDAENARLAKLADSISGTSGGIEGIEDALRESEANLKKDTPHIEKLVAATTRLRELLARGRITRSEARAEFGLEFRYALFWVSPLTKQALTTARPILERLTIPPPK